MSLIHFLWNPTKSKGVSCRDGENHQDGYKPDDNVRSQRRAKWLGRYPECSPWQDSLSTAFPDLPGEPNYHRNHVSERSQGDQEVQAPDCGAVSEHLGEKEACSGELGVRQLIFGDWYIISLLFARCHDWRTHQQRRRRHLRTCIARRPW